MDEFDLIAPLKPKWNGSLSLVNVEMGYLRWSANDPDECRTENDLLP